MVGIIIYEVSNIMCDIGTINMRFYQLEVRYPHGYCRITLKDSLCLHILNCVMNCLIVTFSSLQVFNI